jgi:hypothetical protein
MPYGLLPRLGGIHALNNSLYSLHAHIILGGPAFIIAPPRIINISSKFSK